MQEIATRLSALADTEEELAAYYNSCDEIRTKLVKAGYSEDVNPAAIFLESLEKGYLSRILQARASQWVAFSGACPVPPLDIEATIRGVSFPSDLLDRIVRETLVPVMAALGVQSIEIVPELTVAHGVHVHANQMRSQSLAEDEAVRYVIKAIQDSSLYDPLHATSKQGQNAGSDPRGDGQPE